MKTLTVISPVFQEAAIIRDFYEAVKKQLDVVNAYTWSIVFVVDKGQDNTLEILKDIARVDKKVQILGMSTRFGHQMSLLAGIEHARADVVIMMDSDLQHPPEIIPKLIAEYEKGFEVVNAVRDRTDSIGFFKNISSKIFYAFMNSISEIPMGQNAPDFRLISGRVAHVIGTQIRERNFFLRGIIPWMGYKQTSIRFVAAPRPGGATKYSLRRLINLGVSGIVSFSRKPLRIIFSFGVLLALADGVCALAVLIVTLVGTWKISGLGILGIVVTFLFALQFVALGIVAEYIGAMFDEVKRRPPYLIEEKINFNE